MQELLKIYDLIIVRTNKSYIESTTKYARMLKICKSGLFFLHAIIWLLLGGSDS